MNLVSEFVYEGMDRFVWYKDCMLSFFLFLGICIKEVVYYWGCDYWGCVFLGLYIFESEIVCIWNFMF